MRKYELTGRTKEVIPCTLFSGRRGQPEPITLHEIAALFDFGDVKGGDVGGWVASEQNLSQDGTAWIEPGAAVYDNAFVDGNSLIKGRANVYGSAQVWGNAIVQGNACVAGHAFVYSDAVISGYSSIAGSANILENAQISGNAYVLDNAFIHGNAQVLGNAVIQGNANLGKEARISGMRDVIEINSIAKQDAVTFYRDTAGEVSVVSVKVSPYGTSLESFLTEVDNRYGDSWVSRAYRTAADLAKIQIQG